MTKQLPIEIFMPPNVLKAKCVSASGAVDMAAILRAEQAVETLKVEFTDWVGTDVQRLGECCVRYAAEQKTTLRDELFRAAHDLKGQASTFEYPMIARLASSLTRLMDGTQPTQVPPLGLIDAHVAAIRVVFRDKVRTTTDPISLVVSEELEARVTEALEASEVD